MKYDIKLELFDDADSNVKGDITCLCGISYYILKNSKGSCSKCGVTIERKEGRCYFSFPLNKTKYLPANDGEKNFVTAFKNGNSRYLTKEETIKICEFLNKE